MKKPTVSVLYDEVSKRFKPGDRVVGICFIDTEQKDTTEGVAIEVVGEGKVHWTETVISGRGNDRRVRTIDLEDQKSYVNYTIFSAKRGYILNAGRTEFPFKLYLPFFCPCTFKGFYGSVTYGIKVVITRPPFQSPDEYFLPFQVDSTLDLNSIPEALIPANDSFDFTLCCWFCKSGPITLTLKLNKCGYARGDYIDFQATINNMSNRKIKNCTLTIQQCVTWKAHGHTRINENSIAEARKNEIIKSGINSIWEGKDLQIPLTATPTDLGGFCEFIQVSHKVKLAVHALGQSIESCVQLPIFIGEFVKKEIKPKKIEGLIKKGAASTKKGITAEHGKEATTNKTANKAKTVKKLPTKTVQVSRKSITRR